MRKIDNMIEGTAIAYYLAYKCLTERNLEVADYYHKNLSIYIFPSITVAALSCEIALKNKLNNAGITMYGHDLKKLFYMLPQIAQDEYATTTVCLENYLSSRLNKEPVFDLVEFAKALNSSRLIFTKCRYLYEGIQAIDVDFIESFMFALNDEADQYELFLDQKIRKQ